jgi:hypothetical protein
MKRFLIILGVLAALSACAPESNGEAGGELVVAEKTRSPVSTQVASSSEPLTETNWENELAWVDDDGKIDGHTSISTARSLDEARWLQRHGFLTRSKIERLRRLGFVKVEELARSGDRDAVLFLGEQMIKDGRGDLVAPALNRLVEEEASIPALHLRARYKTSRVSEVPSELPTDSWQWREVAFENSNAKIDVASDYFAAYLLGDYRGSQVASKMFAADPAGFPPAIFTEAARKVAQMAKLQPSIKLDPRPMPDDVRGVNE